MYSSLLFLHSVWRWIAVLSLVYSIWIAFRGYKKRNVFSKADNAIRHWTATIAHIQLILGVILYIKSPVINFFFSNYSIAKTNAEVFFFGCIHSSLMLLSVVLITIGSALAKRRSADTEKFKTMLIWFGLALVIILIAVPWPFSPLASRPYLRPM